MILATTKVKDIDHFLEVFCTKGADKRARTGPRARPSTATRSRRTGSGSLFDWDADGWTAFVSDPDVPPILKAAGHVGKPQAAALAGTYYA